MHSLLIKGYYCTWSCIIVRGIVATYLFGVMDVPWKIIHSLEECVKLFFATLTTHSSYFLCCSQTLLEQIIQQAQHFFMRLRTEYVLDTIAKEVKDPLIVSHWNALNSPTQSCVKINIMTHGYDSVYRTSLVVHVGEKSLKCVCRDGRVMHMSYEPQELRDLIFLQVS